MLGPAKPRQLGPPVVVSLDALVPRDHFYRYLDARLDLTFARDWVKGSYPDRGRPSIDPVVFFKRSLVMVFEGIRSERQLLALAADRLSVRWYLGYGLDEALPDASGFSRIRQRLGLDDFRRFFEQVVDHCQDAGRVWGKERLADATRVSGNAAMDALVPDAAAMARRDGRTVLGDQDHDLLDQCRRTRFRRTLRPARLIADAKDATGENMCAVAEQGVRASMRRPDWDPSSPDYRQAAFTDDREHDVSRGPHGQALKLAWIDEAGERTIYRAPHAVTVVR